MFNSVSHVTASRVQAVDGDLGPVQDVLFDDRDWVIRYLVVDAGIWLAERDVLISPYSIKLPARRDGIVDVALTRQLVRSSPALDIDQPFSPQQEQEFRRHYHYPAYWDGGGLWAIGALPYPSIAPLPNAVSGMAAGGRPANIQLRSAEQVYGYEVLGSDESIGVVDDLAFDDESWQIRYLVVDTQAWWPGGSRMLIGQPWIDRVDWAAQQIHLRVTREQVRRSPVYRNAASIRRDYEVRLHDNYRRVGYWA